jgi:hypothetical protein
MLSNGNISSNGNSSAGGFRAHDADAKKRLNGWHLLVVDDDADVRELLVELVGEHGGVVTAAGSVADAAGVRRRHYDVVLSDLAMPITTDTI